MTYPGPGEPVAAVKYLSFTLARGESLAVVGEGGSGKSAVALALGGLLPLSPPTRVSGSVRLDGTDILTLPESRRRPLRGRRMAWVFQDAAGALNPAFTLGQQFEEVLAVHRPNIRERRAHALQLLEAVGFPEPPSAWRERPEQRPDGHLQLFSLAMALAPQPDVLIADEPTAGLDLSLQARAFEFLRTWRRDHSLAVILLTNHLALAAGFADNLVILRDGLAVETGPTGDLIRQPRHSYTRELLAAVPRLRHVSPPATT